MIRKNRDWHPKFIEYMNMIVNHSNYYGLPIERKADGTLSWIATAKSQIGQARIAWALQKATELGLELKAGVYADVMLMIHPTKWKVCQICGREMSLYYHYPNANFLKSLNESFHCNFTECDHISNIWDYLINNGIGYENIAQFLIQKGSLNIDICNSSKEAIITELEIACRKGNKKCLGPGAMSNFPDRYDGFHTYNRCCRAYQDKGRSRENLKSYTKDRRAYEYWSDGNIHAANQFMGSNYFKDISADHVGPISLGFVHDPRYLQPMLGGDNSAKRDRLQIVDIEHIIEIERKTGIYPMSWQSKLIWEYIKQNYKLNPEYVSTIYKNALKQNMANYMFILKTILVECPNNGKMFLEQNFLKPNFKCFEKDYSFNANGYIIHEEPRHYTGRNANEIERYCRIAFDSVFEYSKKNNRNIKNDLTEQEYEKLLFICQSIETNFNVSANKENIISLIESVELRIIDELK